MMSRAECEDVLSIEFLLFLREMWWFVAAGFGGVTKLTCRTGVLALRTGKLETATC